MDTHDEMAAGYRKRAGELREIAAELSSLVHDSSSWKLLMIASGAPPPRTGSRNKSAAMVAEFQTGAAARFDRGLGRGLAL